MGRLIFRVLGGMVLLAGGSYLVDGAIAKARGSSAFGQVQVQPYYAVPMKDGKTQFIMLDPETDTCIHSLFPHFGYRPCWRMEAHKQLRINM
jgi:hypothetical protein